MDFPASLQVRAAIVLFALVAVVTLQMRRDVADYRAFKALTLSRDRQRRYGVWALKSFLLFGGGALVGLVVMGRLAAVMTPPPEFAGLADILPKHIFNSGFLIGAAGGAAGVGLILGLQLARARKTGAAAPGSLGDVEPLLPRNGAERAWATLLSLNAGFSEELFFRLLLPLLLTILTGQPLVSVAIACILFGVVHAYQGWIGILATTAMGAALTVIYLASGSLWVAMGVHALIDLNGLILRPLLSNAWRRAPAA